jgi:hypothetical protein
MKSDKIVMINGREYNRDTGLPITDMTKKSAPAVDITAKTAKFARIVSAKPKALYSHATQKTFNDITAPRRKTGHNMDIKKSKHISHFAPVAVKNSKSMTSHKKGMDIKPISHPISAKISKLRLASKNIPSANVKKSDKEIKQEVIAQALKKATTPAVKKEGLIKRHKKYVNIFTIGAAILVIIGAVVYLNLPLISVRVASIQAGIDASFPEYHPDGYSLSGPVLYSNGQVTINFHSNSNNSKFVIKQSKSPLDSSALKIQVDNSSNHQTSQSQEGGLTIYTYNNNNNAEWVNGGILYSISGDAKLSSDQIRHIATSL